MQIPKPAHKHEYMKFYLSSFRFSFAKKKFLLFISIPIVIKYVVYLNFSNKHFIEREISLQVIRIPKFFSIFEVLYVCVLI